MSVLARSRVDNDTARRRPGRRPPASGAVSAVPWAAVAVLAAACALVPRPAAAQPQFAHDAFADPVARQLYLAAYEGWSTLDESIVRYAARIDQRIAAAIRTPLRDRVLYHNETSVRAFWERDFDPVLQVLGSRSEYPGQDIARREGDLDWLEDLPFDAPFEPGGERLFLGMDSDGAFADDPDANEFSIVHPLAPGADSVYRFQSGDTLTLSLPDGRSLRSIRLDVLPRAAASHRISGVLWIEPESGALVRAAYRLSRDFDAMRDIPELQAEEEAGSFRYVPGVLKPWTFSLNLVSVEYALWDFKAWLPRAMRIEGEAAAGVLKFPVSMDMAYQVESVVLEHEAAAAAATIAVAGQDPANPADPADKERTPAAGDDLRHVHFGTRGEAMAFIAALLAEGDEVPYELMPETETPARDRASLLIVPEDRSHVARSVHLPPPIWEKAPGFASPEDLAEQIQSLADLPAPPVQLAPWQFNWGWARHDLLRYNRVEGPAVGGRLDWDLGDRWTLGTSGFFGFADLRPKGRLDLERASVLRRLSLGAYRELRASGPATGHFGPGNSLDALLFGRDNGEYFRATGVDFAWRPPAGNRQSRSFRIYAERQAPVASNLDFALFRVLDGDWAFRPNLTADRVDEAGAEFMVAPWWGADPLKWQLGLEVKGRAAAWRDAGGASDAPPVRDRAMAETSGYAQAAATVRAIVPLAGQGWEGWRLGIEAGGGHTWGDAPVQRSWFLGGSSTLRGYGPSTASGLSYARGRIEASRVYHGVGASLFGDVGWAGAPGAFAADDILYGIGIGGSVLEGLIRLDLSQGLKGPAKDFRVEMYLDAIL